MIPNSANKMSIIPLLCTLQQYNLQVTTPKGHRLAIGVASATQARQSGVAKATPWPNGGPWAGPATPKGQTNFFKKICFGHRGWPIHLQRPWGWLRPPQTRRLGVPDATPMALGGGRTTPRATVWPWGGQGPHKKKRKYYFIIYFLKY
jgi:hypothetical protein